MILLDEVEKAHPEVFNVLLQLLDDGRLTDGQGRTVDFRNTVVIMTSNLGSQHIVDMADDKDRMNATVMDVVKQHFRPEFINRIDEILIFNSLGKAEIEKIVRIQLAALAARIAAQGYSITYTDEAADYLPERASTRYTRKASEAQ